MQSFAAARGGLAALLVALAACAGPNAERNLAPVFSSHSAAGGIPEVEALGGMLLTRKDADAERRRYWAVRPIVSSRFDEDEDRQMWFLPPLGFLRTDADRGYRILQLQPLFRTYRETEASGFVTRTLLVLPSFYWGKHEDGRTQVMVFPLFGLLEGFISLDRGTFALFPLWFRMERYGRTTDHFLWPFFTWSRGTGGHAFRAWPLFSNNRWKGRYNRWSLLWPFFYFHRNDLQFSEEQHQTSWMIWPLFGRSTRGPASETVFLWPLFGRTVDPETGFWAWDGPFPLVRFQGGDPDRPVRKRVWPFYSFYKGDGLTSRWWAWPLANKRREVYADGQKDAFSIFPLWRSYQRRYDEASLLSEGPARTESGRKLWPLGKTRKVVQDGETVEHDFTLIDLNPQREFDFVDEHYAWLWELYTRKAKGDQVRSRAWLGLWRREKDGDEDRRSLSVLWSARDYDRAGRRTKERSWLFGLLRYRSVEGDGWSFLRPAFPGPGWPLRRTPASRAVAANGGEH